MACDCTGCGRVGSRFSSPLLLTPLCLLPAFSLPLVLYPPLDPPCHFPPPPFPHSLVDLLPNHLRAAMEEAITSSLDTVVATANAALQALPRIVPIDSTAALDATLPADPEIDGQSISLACHGRFLPSDRSISSHRAAASAAADVSTRSSVGGSGLSIDRGADISSYQGVRVLGERGAVGSAGGEVERVRDEDEGEARIGGGKGEEEPGRVMGSGLGRGSEGGSVVDDTKCVGEGDECADSGQMVALSLSQHLVASASQVYYQTLSLSRLAGALSYTINHLPYTFPWMPLAGALSYTINHLPDSFPWKLLNTKGIPIMLPSPLPSPLRFHPLPLPGWCTLLHHKPPPRLLPLETSQHQGVALDPS
ncbi:unnamed protein product [Closterium sp. Naga37s-1]|nr:unnamed protein product [Closterium sp. Naga37s-1]